MSCPLHRNLVCALIPIAAGACADHSVATVLASNTIEETTNVRVDKNRDVDLLFVIDNSISMEPEQASLAANFPLLIDALTDGEAGLPSIHIAVTTTDIGAGAACPGSGQGGQMLSTGPGCIGPSDSFISDIALEDGTRTRNYSGSLADTFSCIANVGAKGCGFEQPLEAMRLALDSHPGNAGFLRDHALLAVVFVTDEDDCSTADPAMFATAPTDLSSPLGPPDSFRCFEFGVECDGDDPRSAGLRRDCRPRVGSAYMHDVSRYSTFLRELKPFSSQVIVASISGPLSPVAVEVGPDPRFPFDTAKLVESCDNELGDAVPAIRLRAALDAAGALSSTHVAICDQNLAPAVQAIADRIAEASSGCVRGELYDANPATPELDPDCTVSEQYVDQNDARVERVLQACDNVADPGQSSNVPCYSLAETDACRGKTPSGLELEVFYDPGYAVPPGTLASIRCQAE